MDVFFRKALVSNQGFLQCLAIRDRGTQVRADIIIPVDSYDDGVGFEGAGELAAGYFLGGHETKGLLLFDDSCFVR